MAGIEPICDESGLENARKHWRIKPIRAYRNPLPRIRLIPNSISASGAIPD